MMWARVLRLIVAVAVFGCFLVLGADEDTPFKVFLFHKIVTLALMAAFVWGWALLNKACEKRP